MKKIILLVLVIVMITIVTFGISYAAFSYTSLGQKVNTITTGAVSMSYEESENSINLVNALPTTQTTGKKRLNSGEYFDFTIILNGLIQSWYESNIFRDTKIERISRK